MFPFIGIMADEEPRTEISSNGLYNSSFVSGQKTFSSPLISGDSEFTFMFWVYRSAGSANEIYKSETVFINGSPVTYVSIESNTPSITLRTSNGTTMTCTSSVSIISDEWSHIAFTGSLISNSLKVYVNGISRGNVVMSYSLITSNSGFLKGDFLGGELAQINKYNRELSEAEVLEHIADDGTNGIGVLSYDAMTPAQQSGLTYCSSFIKDISIGGNEFSDKSGNGITLSPQPDLTGEQIYVYTSLAPPVANYPVSASSFDRAVVNTYYKLSNPPMFVAQTALSIVAYVYLDRIDAWNP